MVAVAHAPAYSSIAAPALQALGFHQHPGAQLPLATSFRDSTARAVRLGDFFGRRPVVLVMEYLRCRTLCGVVLEDTASALRRTSLQAGRDYQVVAISIDPRDGPADARAARQRYLGGMAARPAAAWHFLTGSPQAIQRVAAAVGFAYRYDAATDQYAHAAGISIATPQGRLSRYLLGVGYRPLDLRLAIAEADREQVASPVADLLLLCYCYDPGTGRYSLAIGNITRALCLATALGIALLVLRLRRRGS